MAHVEKDRTGILAGQTIPWPTFDNLALPLLGLLGGEQAAMPTDDEVGVKDAEALARQEVERDQRSLELAKAYVDRIAVADTVSALQRVGGELTACIKKDLAAPDLARIRAMYAKRLAQLKTPDDSTSLATVLPDRNGAEHGTAYDKAPERDDAQGPCVRQEV